METNKTFMVTVVTSFADTLEVEARNELEAKELVLKDMNGRACLQLAEDHFINGDSYSIEAVEVECIGEYDN
jgi:hypothetical protein